MNKLYNTICFFILTLAAFSSLSQDIQARFTVKFGDEVTPHAITGVFLLPGEQLKIEPLFEDNFGKYDVLSTEGDVEKLNQSVWQWTAPTEKGVYPVTVKEINSGDSVLLNCIVMVPYSDLSGTSLNGYKIGAYPQSANKLYSLPRGFIEVTKENENTLITPHYTLKNFLCKQAGSYPKYLVLKERGILKLEMVHSYLNGIGVKFDAFKFISGYRTPFYNKSIGNVKNSRHVFGDAYDLYIDEDGNGKMDDLNGDGKEDKKDVRFLYSKIDGLYNQAWYKPFIGGLGLYGPNSRRSGFIHMDSRGYRARWGE